MNTESLKNQLADLKKQIDGLGMAIPGSIQITYLRCGKKNCRCHQAEDQRHGPYYLDSVRESLIFRIPDSLDF